MTLSDQAPDALLVAEEIAHRQQTHLGRLVRRARFPFLKNDRRFQLQTGHGSTRFDKPRPR
jgi:hypothetical protein